jgi:hypothetical protein
MSGMQEGDMLLLPLLLPLAAANRSAKPEPLLGEAVIDAVMKLTEVPAVAAVGAAASGTPESSAPHTLVLDAPPASASSTSGFSTPCLVEPF